jgi:DNA-directed RNA polymerase sigma subunit (sigma70/sigma32)
MGTVPIFSTRGRIREIEAKALRKLSRKDPEDT